MLAKEFNVSESTIKRDSKFAEGLDILGRVDLNLKTRILAGQVRAKKSFIESLPKTDDPITLARRFATGDLQACEKDNQNLNWLGVSSDDEKCRRLRALIIRLTNKVIAEKNREDLKELKLLVARLERQLLSERKRC